MLRSTVVDKKDEASVSDFPVFLTEVTAVSFIPCFRALTLFVWWYRGHPSHGSRVSYSQRFLSTPSGGTKPSWSKLIQIHLENDR